MVEERYGIEWRDTHGVLNFSHASVVADIASKVAVGQVDNMWLNNRKGHTDLVESKSDRTFAGVKIFNCDSADATEEDIAYLNETNFPFLKIAMPKGRFKMLYPIAYKENMPLEGRPWKEGHSDCYRLVLDYYRNELGIPIREVITPANYTVQMQSYCKTNLYLESYESSGFEQVLAPEPGDAFFIKTGGATFDGPDHVGICVSEGKILHHYRNRLSVIQDYSGIWKKRTVMVLRHTSRL
jgi:hypothetical protein